MPGTPPLAPWVERKQSRRSVGFGVQRHSKSRRSSPRGLERTVVLSGGVKVQIQGVSRQVHMNDVGRPDAEGAGSGCAVAANLDLVLAQRDLEFLRFLEDAVLNVSLRLGGVGLQRRLARDDVLELVIRVVNRDQFCPQENRGNDDEYAKKKLDGSHSALPFQRAKCHLVRRPQSLEMLCYCADASILHYPSRALNHFHGAFGNPFPHRDTKGYAH